MLPEQLLVLFEQATYRVSEQQEKYFDSPTLGLRYKSWMYVSHRRRKGMDGLKKDVLDGYQVCFRPRNERGVDMRYEDQQGCDDSLRGIFLQGRVGS